MTKSWKQLDKYVHVEFVVCFVGRQNISLQVAFADKVLLNKAPTFLLEGQKRCGQHIVSTGCGWNPWGSPEEMWLFEGG